MKLSAVLCLFVGAIFLVNVNGQAAPTLEGYSISVRLQEEFTPIAGAPNVFLYADTAPGIARVGIVYQPWGENNISDIWIGVGWSPSCLMLTEGQPSDAVITWIDGNYTAHLEDYYLYAKDIPSTLSCLTQNDSICADPSKGPSFNCSNNAQLVSSNVTDDGWAIVEFTRPLGASDMCDIAVPTGTPICMLVALGFFQLAGSDPWPDNLQKHTYHVNDPENVKITWPVPPASTTASTTAMPTTTGPITTTGTTTSPISTSTTGVVSTTGSSSSAATTGAHTSSSSGSTSASTTGVGSTTGPVDCSNLVQKCEATCGDLKVKMCRCINDQPSVQCSSESEASVTVISFGVIGIAMMLAL